jgi:hypothetical protein
LLASHTAPAIGSDLPLMVNVVAFGTEPISWPEKLYLGLLVAMSTIWCAASPWAAVVVYVMVPPFGTDQTAPVVPVTIVDVDPWLVNDALNVTGLPLLSAVGELFVTLEMFGIDAGVLLRNR